MGILETILRNDAMLASPVNTLETEPHMASLLRVKGWNCLGEESSGAC